VANAVFLHAGTKGLSVVPLSLHERKSRMVEYFRREDPQLSSVLDSILTHAFSGADPVCSTLALWAADACGGNSETALPVAVAVECLSRFSLLHDELHQFARRARCVNETVPVWGVAQTLNAGDACHGLALKLIGAKSSQPGRTLAVAIMLEEEVLRSIADRSRLVRIGRRGPRGSRRRRIAYAGARALGLSTSMRAGAMIAGAERERVEGFSRAGHRLDIAAALASADDFRGKSPVAGRFAASAITEVRNSAVPPEFVREFEEIAHHLAAGD
jgi:hypothetical protein